MITIYKTQQIISDANWTNLKKCSGLPDKARPHIEDTLAYFHKYGRIKATPPAILKAEFDGMRKRLLDAKKVASALRSNPEKFNTYSNVFPGDDEQSRKETARKSLSEVEQALKALSDRVEAAGQTIGPGKTGGKNVALWVTINALNVFLLLYTQKELNRIRRYTIAGEGTAEFAIRALRLADHNLTDGTILNAIKNQIEPFAEVDLLDGMVRLVKEADTAQGIFDFS